MTALEDHLPAYIVEADNGRYRVATANGRNCMTCRDEPSAAHYADLMNQAFAAGYKRGYRDARAD